MWQVQISHQGLNKFRVVRGATQAEAELKAAWQRKAWDEQWQRVQLARAEQRKRERVAEHKGLKKQLAEEQTNEAETAIRNLEVLLANAAKKDHRVDWSKLKDNTDCPVRSPTKPLPQSVPSEPLRMAFPANLKWFERLLTPVREKRIAEAEQRFQAAHTAWRITRGGIEKSNAAQFQEYERQVAQWEKEKASWLEDQEERNATIGDKEAAYTRGDPTAVVEYIEMVLNGSEYPEAFPSGFELDYIAETHMLVMDYSLPAIEALPTVKAYRYVATRDEVQPVAVAESWLNKTYDSVLYHIRLRLGPYTSFSNRTQPMPWTPLCSMVG